MAGEARSGLEPFDRQSIVAWWRAGHVECSPTQASGLLRCAPYSLNVQAKYLRDRGADRMGGVHFRFSGNRLRLNVQDIMARCGLADARTAEGQEA